jgi:hypothetical protein
VKAASTEPRRRQIEQLHSIASVGSASRLYAILPQWQLPRIGVTPFFDLWISQMIRKWLIQRSLDWSTS